MEANRLHILRTIRDENHALLGGYEAELDELHRSRMILRGPSGWWLSDLGKQELAVPEARAVD